MEIKTFKVQSWDVHVYIHIRLKTLIIEILA